MTAAIPSSAGPQRLRALDRGAISSPRWKLLAETSVALDASLEYEDTLATVVRLAVPRLADHAAIVLLAEDRSLSWSHSEHRDSTTACLFERALSYPMSPPGEHDPLGESLRSGEIRVVKEVDEAFLRMVARDHAHLDDIRALQLASLMFLPIVARGRTLGIITFATTTQFGRRYGDRDIAIATEVGRRVALAVDRALLYKEARDAARARDDMIAVVSHDLKNPLATIQLAVALLLELVPEDEAPVPMRTALMAIKRTAVRMYRLIHDLLDVAAADAGQLVVTPTSNDVAALVDEAIEAARPLAAAKEITLVADVDPAVSRILADHERVLQVLSNLLGNAIKFTPVSGRVQLCAENAEVGNFVEFAVQDTGAGIGTEQLSHIFDRFWRANQKARSGTGLGLPIVKAIVEAHGGSVRVESELGNGSCFFFTLGRA